MNETFPSASEAALECAARGWHVFPAVIRGGAKKSHKSAQHSNGRAWGATTDPDEIRKDWAKWPEALLGIVTGPKSGFFVIEADTVDGHGVNGIAHLRDLIEQNGGIPNTIEAESPTGSWHLYFRYPEGRDITNSTGSASNGIAPGIDVRGDGGMVIAPPSYRAEKGGAYKWKNPRGFFALGDCPEWLLELATKPKAKLSERAAPKPIATGSTDSPFWRNVNTAALADLDCWVPALLPAAQKQATGAWRVASGDLGRNLEEDLSLHPDGIQDFGHEVTMTAIDVVQQISGKTLKDAAFWLCDKLGVAPATFGWRVTASRAHTSDGASRANTPDEFDLSHDALARDLGARSWNQNAKHVAIWGKWLFWTGTRWEIDERLRHMTETRDYLSTRAEELADWAQRKAEKETTGDPKKDAATARTLETWARDNGRALRSKATVAAIADLARSNPASVAAVEDFDANLMLLGTPGGVVGLRTGTLRPARREDMITKLTACAPGDPGKRPDRWLRFLGEIFNDDQEVIAFMQRAAGYALTGETREHKLLFLYGTGRNGKSVFLNTLMSILADYARRVPAATFLHSNTERHPTDIAGLHGARLAVASELPKGKTWDESTIKDLTGGDRLTARRMRQDFFDFDPQLTLMIAGNNMPSFRGVDEAIRSRVVLVPFTVTIPPERRDTGLPDKLKAEAPAILRWAIDGALAWQKRGLDVPASIAAASAEYFDDEDTVGQFIEDEAELHVGAFTDGDLLAVRFTQWCERQGLHPWTKRTLMKELRSRGFEDAKSNGFRGLRGVRLRPHTDFNGA